MINSGLLRRVGVKIGHYTNGKDLTGVTVFIAESGAEIGIDIRGSGTGTLNTPTFDPKSAGKIVHAVVLTGGSIFGLESAFGVLEYLEVHGIGNRRSGRLVPGITGAVIHDLAVGNDKRPTKENGVEAAQNNSYENTIQGNIGVGTGATIGKWFKGEKRKGGFGIAAKMLVEDIIVVAFVVTNAIGNVIASDSSNPTGRQELYDNSNPEELKRLSGLMDFSGKNTTLGVIATNVKLNKIQLMKIAELAHDGMARSIYPVHTSLDGDIVFALSSLDGERIDPPLPDTVLVDLVGLAAADALEEAIRNSVRGYRKIIF
ncbi:MAG: P1 family peptidase [Firmicutes bacterium]|nr:P1 family peptidase [Bacillota bacterium]